MVGPSTIVRPCRRAGRACALALFGATVVFAPNTASARDAAPPRETEQPGPSAPRLPDVQRPLGVPKTSSTPKPTAEAPGPATGAIRTVISLGAVLGLVGLAAFVIKRLARSHGGLLGAAGPGGRAPAGVLEVLGRYPLSRGQTMILLKLDRRVLLLSQSVAGRLGGASLTTLCEINDPDEIASILVKVRDEEGESLAHRFQSALGLADRATADAAGDPAPARRTTVHASGDRVELWSDGPSQPAQPRGFSQSLTDPARAIQEPASETGADALRRRLGALRRLDAGEEEVGR